MGGTLIGALLMGFLNNGMSLANISQFMQSVVKGLVLSVKEPKTGPPRRQGKEALQEAAQGKGRNDYDAMDNP